MSLRGSLVATAAIALSLLAVACGGSSSPSGPSGTTGGTTGGGSGTNGGGAGNAIAVSVVSGASRLTNTAYSPDGVTVPVGGTVTWTNNDAITHTATANNSSFNVSLPPGGSGSFTFKTAGSYPYYCAIHPGMIGTVTVQ